MFFLQMPNPEVDENMEQLCAAYNDTDKCNFNNWDTEDKFFKVFFHSNLFLMFFDLPELGNFLFQNIL